MDDFWERLKNDDAQKGEPGAILLSFCESHIEVLLGSYLLMAFEEYVYGGATMCLPEQAADHPATEVLIIPQFPWMQYRVDFAVRIPRTPPRFLFVECDGHEFHQATPQQIEHDKRRDQEMTDAGYRVVRFTGSAIVHDPSWCAARVMAEIMMVARQSWESGQ